MVIKRGLFIREGGERHGCLFKVNRPLEMDMSLNKAHLHPKYIQALTLVSIWHDGMRLIL